MDKIVKCEMCGETLAPHETVCESGRYPGPLFHTECVEEVGTDLTHLRAAALLDGASAPYNSVPVILTWARK